MTDSQFLGTIWILRNLNEHHYDLTSAKSMICQINTNCSSFQLLNVSFRIKLEMPKTDLLQFFYQIFLNITLKLAKFGLIFLSSHVFAILKFDNSYFGILL